MGARAGTGETLTSPDREMLDTLVQQMGPRLLAYVRRAYRHVHDAEDIVAETFCRAAMNMNALKATDRPDLYLLTIARNLCRDHFRRQRPIAVAGDQLAQRPGQHPEPERHSMTAERRAALQAAVAKLPESLREVVVLRMSTDLKFEEIAALLHVPLGTALSRMHSAMKRLRKHLEHTDVV